MSNVRAKFKVTGINRSQTAIYVKDEQGKQVPQAAELQTIVLSPVYGNGDPEHENTKFWQASPSGKIELGTVNEAAARAFELGAESYVDFTRAPA